MADLPLAVLTNGAIHGSVGAEWVEAHRGLAAQSTCSTHFISRVNSHMMHWSQPERVAAAIREVVDAVRGRRDAAPVPGR